ICLYVGIPFCPTRCTYCSFVALDVEKSTRLLEPYLAALTQEINATAAIVRDLGLCIVSLYIGGGTPTTLSTAQLRALTETLAAAFDLSHLQEYTVEAGRPDTIDLAKLQILQAAGVDRISINPQSMEDTVLAAIGRRHTAADIYEAVEMAQSVGFPVLNMDLIAGLPADTPAGFARTLDQVLVFGAENITVHTLARKRGAFLTADKIQIPGPEEMARMLDTAERALTGAGYRPYYLYRQKFTAGGFENVGWSKPGDENLYNIAIMEELTSIIGLGAGAATKLVNPHTGRIPRKYNPKYPLEYTEGIDRILASKELIREFYLQEVFRHGTDV
ncbi:MAG: coproporphyrinogen dehydrogenase HemZ, partial [Oscillospiraceae bacterium]|nr:coproporphyrinogen dehydrogenase HemZ [Oscillospiraceae bacterium]